MIQRGAHTNAPVFADSATAHLFNHWLIPISFWLWVAMSPFGWLAWQGVRWLAGRLHGARTPRQSDG